MLIIAYPKSTLEDPLLLLLFRGPDRALGTEADVGGCAEAACSLLDCACSVILSIPADVGKFELLWLRRLRGRSRYGEASEGLEG